MNLQLWIGVSMVISALLLAYCFLAMSRHADPGSPDVSAVLNFLKEKVMPTINDINAALDQLGVSLGTQLTAIQTEIQQLANAGGATPDQLQAIIDRIGAFKTGVDQTIADLGADDPAAPPAG